MCERERQNERQRNRKIGDTKSSIFEKQRPSESNNKIQRKLKRERECCSALQCACSVLQRAREGGREALFLCESIDV